MSAAALVCLPRMSSTTWPGAFATNAGLPSFFSAWSTSFCATARSRPSRARSAATSIAPDVSSSTTTVRPARQRDLHGGRRRELAPGLVEPHERGERDALSAEARLVEAGEPGRDAPLVGHALLGAEAADVGDERLQVGDPRGRRSGIDRHAPTSAGQGAITTDSAPVSAW